MTDYVIPAPVRTAVPVASGGLFPVRRVFCVGRNYAAHAREMGHDPEREAPFFFMKPADSLVMSGADMPYPPMTAELHHELELVVALGEGGADVAAEAAMSSQALAARSSRWWPAQTARRSLSASSPGCRVRC